MSAARVGVCPASEQAEKIKEHDKESDAYTDVDEPDPYILVPHHKECWVCGGVDERTDTQYKVLCWEDIDLWILHDPMRKIARFPASSAEVERVFSLSKLVITS